MNNPTTLTMLFNHHRWANLFLLEHCAKLTDEQLDSSVSGAFGTIRNTWQHIVTGEQSYFSRISTGQPRRRSPDEPPLSFAEMAASLHHTGTGLLEWAAKVQADDLVQIDWDGTMREVPKTLLFTQAINHATEHRAQIMVMLTQLGIEPPEVSGWAYYGELMGF
jgi:uncharacterized damage-inducible protein DinB